MPLILNIDDDIELCLVGRGYVLNSELKNIKYLGFVEDINNVYNSASIFVSPINSGAGIKNKILEAMSTKIPIVCSKESLNGIDYGNIFDECIAESNEEFVLKIIDVLQNYSKYCGIAERAYEMVVKNYNWDYRINEYIHIMDLN